MPYANLSSPYALSATSRKCLLYHQNRATFVGNLKFFGVSRQLARCRVRCQSPTGAYPNSLHDSRGRALVAARNYTSQFRPDLACHASVRAIRWAIVGWVS